MAPTYRPKQGLDGVVYAILDETTDVIGGTPTYGTIYPLSNVESLKVNENGSATTYFGDNAPRHAGETTGVIDVEFMLSDLLPQDIANLFGHVYANGAIVKNASDVSPNIALGFRILRTGKLSGNPVYEYVWLYKGVLIKPDSQNDTKKDKIVFGVPTIKGQFLARIADGLTWIKTRTDDPLASSAFLTGFFSAVATHSADLGALSCAITKGTAGDAGKLLFTFSKVGGGSFSMDAATCIAANLLIGDATTVRAGAFAMGGAGTTVVVKFTPTAAFAAESIGAAVSAHTKDANGVACAANAKSFVYT